MKRLAAGLLLALIAVALLPSLAISAGLTGLSAALLRRSGDGPRPTANELSDRARRVLAVSPLATRAYLADGLALDQQGRRADAEALIGWSQLIDPRLIEARLWLGLRYFETGRVAPALDQLATLYRLAPEYHGQLSLILASAARVPDARRQIAARFANDPLILGIAEKAQQSGMPPAQLLQLLASSRLPSMPDGISTAQRLVIGSSLIQGDLVSAYGWWLLPLAERPTNAVFDGDFGGRDAATPFTWTLASGASVAAHRIDVALPGHSIAVELRSSGVLPVTVAEQTIILPPGSHLLRGVVRSDIPAGREAGFDWVMTCAPSGQQVAHLPLIGTSGRWAAQSWPVVVPGGCPALKLQIVGAPVAAADAESVIQVTGIEADPTPASDASRAESPRSAESSRSPSAGRG